MASPPLPVVCVPGTLCDARVFDDLLVHLPREATHAAPIAQATVQAAASAILAAAPPRFVAIGFSLGGFAIFEILRSAPGRLAAAVLIASNAHALAAGGAEARRAEVLQARSDGMAALIQDLWPRYVGRAALGRSYLCKTLTAMAEQVGIARFEQQAELAINRPDSRSTAQNSAVPTLMIYGDEDSMCSVERYRAATGPNLQRLELPGVGHFVPLEAPATAGRAIDEWLKTVLPCS